jgi:hypothetical protein
MPAYFGPWRLIAAEPVPPELVALARKLVGSMLEVGGIPQRQWNLPGGGSIHALLVNGMPKVTIRLPRGAAAVPSAAAALWVPRGFVVTPAGTAAPRGAGLPVVATDANPYAVANLDPGLDFARWTPGGPLNQVLLTPDADAGYPPVAARAMPAFYGRVGVLNNDPGAGYDSRTPGRTWHAYRPSFVGFPLHSGSDPAPARAALFEAVNQYRADHGVAKAYLMPRALYHPAESLAELVRDHGLAQAGYPPGYRTPADRLLKDGPWSDETPGYGELVAVGGTVNAVVASWAVAHSAELLLDSPGKQPVVLDAALDAGNWAVTTQVRMDWIRAGRRSFQSSDADLPPISWDAPPARNLGWMTFPVTQHDRQIWSPAQPLVDASGRWWLRYFHSDYGYRPALGPNVYCRGRALGVLPNQGLVLGAGVSVQYAAQIDRLHVLAYHAADNAATDMATQGLMAVARLWYVDFPSRDGQRLHAEAPITQAYDPTAPRDFGVWRDAGTVTLPGIKYESFWEFGPDGATAVCLRDGAVVQDILDWWSTAFAGGNGGGIYTGAFKGVLAELTIDQIARFSLRTTALATGSWLASRAAAELNYLPHLAPTNPSSVPADAWAVENPLVPLAAGYVNGQVRVAYAGNATLVNTAADPRNYGAGVVSDVGVLGYAVFGGADIQYPSQGDATVVSRAELGDAADHWFYAANTLQVADLATRAVVVDGADAMNKVAGWTAQVDAGSGQTYYTVTYASTGEGAGAMLNTTDAVRRVRAFQHGALVHDAAYPHPYGVLWNTTLMLALGWPTDSGGAFIPSPLAPGYSFNWDTSSWAIFPPVNDLTLQPVFAERFGEQVFGYQVALATPITTLAFGAQGRPTMTDYAAAFATDLTQTITAENRPAVGGQCAASFDVPDYGAQWLAEALAC